MQLFEDPKAKDRSLMSRQPTLCNGQRTGFQCKMYWAMRKKIDTVNPDALAKGEVNRFCLNDRAEITFLGDGGADMAVQCTCYEPNWSRKYDEEFESFKPLEPEEIAELERKQAAGEPLPEPASLPPIPGGELPEQPKTTSTQSTSFWSRLFGGK